MAKRQKKEEKKKKENCMIPEKMAAKYENREFLSWHSRNESD